MGLFDSPPVHAADRFAGGDRTGERRPLRSVVRPSSEAEILRAHIAAVRTRIEFLDGGAHMSKRIFLAMASLAALVLSSGASVTWMR